MDGFGLNIQNHFLLKNILMLLNSSFIVIGIKLLLEFTLGCSQLLRQQITNLNFVYAVIFLLSGEVYYCDLGMDQGHIKKSTKT